MSEIIDHPAPRAVHAVNNALEIINGIDPLDTASAFAMRMAWGDLRRLLEPVLEDVAALQQYVEVQEANILTMSQESMETHRALTEEREKTAGALAALREATARIAAAHAGECDAKLDPAAQWSLECTEPKGHEGNHIARGLDEQVLATWPQTITHHDTPRTAAGAR